MTKRPDPDKLLETLRTQEQKTRRGKLKIFFGACAGVGKTYAMLEAAHRQKKEGVDVTVGFVETHNRPETVSLLAELEILTPRSIEYKGVTLREFDLDAALERKPDLILVDELAHTNVPGSRHPKRWQDVQELLDREIDVYTTLNVQHIESVNDVVAQITGVIVKETLPDSVFEKADEIELIDLPSGELLKRFKEGRVYVPQQAERAMQSFFRESNLVALREIALRVTADRINIQVQQYREAQTVQKTWATTERLLVCISSSPASLQLVRAAARMAKQLHVDWIAAYVESSAEMRLPEKARVRAIEHLRLAERLGAETIVLSGQHVVEEIINYARSRNVTTIIVGQPMARRWKTRLFGSPVDQLIRESGDIHVHVIRGNPNPTEPSRPLPQLENSRFSYLFSIEVVLGSSLFCGLVYHHLALANLIMIYLSGVVMVAWYAGRGPSILASFLSVLTFDFFFVPPRFTFAVADYEYLITFLVMLAVALVISDLTSRVRKQAEISRLRERRTAALYSLSRELASNRGVDTLLQVAVRHMAEVFESRVIFLLPNPQGRLVTKASWPAGFAIDDKEQSVAQWVYDTGDVAGKGTDTLPAAETLFVPMLVTGQSVGVLGIRPSDPQRLLIPEQFHLLEAFAHQAALALECDRLSEEHHQTQVQMETERLKNVILSSIPHDLRTPLAAIAGSATSLRDEGQRMDPSTRQELVQNICDETERLTSVINNVLDLTKLESGALKLNKDPMPIEEVIGSALSRLEKKLGGRPIKTDVAKELPMVPMDGQLMEQVLLNLMDNALKYTPEGSPVEISARADGEQVVVEVADRGPGLPGPDVERLFEKFYRGNQAGREGFGLGLTICRGILEAHGGRITAENRSGGGAVFRFFLPLKDS